MGAALVAYVDRQNHSIELDPAVRPGTNFTPTEEAVLLHTTSIGHSSEAADRFARELRDAGWRVTIREVDEFLPIRQAGIAPTSAVADQAPNVRSTYDGIGPVTRRASGGTKWLCLTCGHSVRSQRHVDSHRRNLGHDEFEQVAVADLSAPQAQIDHAQAQASPPDGQEAPSSAAG